MTSSTPQHVLWEDVPLETLNPLLQRRYVSGAETTIAQIFLKKGCVVPTHSHHNEQISTIMSGALRFTFHPEENPQQVTVRPVEVLVIPANVPHTAEALEDTLNLDIFAPRREDWISGADAYLR